MKLAIAKKIFAFTLLLLMGTFLCVPAISSVRAQSWVDTKSDCTKTGDCNPCDLVAVVVRYCDGIFFGAGTMAMFMFAFGGVVMLTAYGNENRITWGKNVIVATVIGIFIVFAAWILVNVFIGAFFGMPTSSTAIKIFGDQAWNVCPVSGSYAQSTAQKVQGTKGFWDAAKAAAGALWNYMTGGK